MSPGTKEELPLFRCQHCGATYRLEFNPKKYRKVWHFHRCRECGKSNLEEKTPT